MVADALDGVQQVFELDLGGVIGDGGALRGEVDGGIDPAQPVELLLDPGGARRARHPCERELRPLQHLGHTP